MLSRIATALAAVAILASPAAAQKKPAVTSFPFWTAPKQPHANDFVPGLTAALELTPEQVAKIVAAREATVDSPEIRALKGKGDPNATPDELAAAATKRAEAAEKLHKQVDGVLTNDQKALIEKVNEAYAKAVAEVAEDFQPKIVAAKGSPDDVAALRKEQREAVVTSFEKKLGGVLTAAQQKAVDKAAEEAKKRAGDRPEKPKK